MRRTYTSVGQVPGKLQTQRSSLNKLVEGRTYVSTPGCVLRSVCCTDSSPHKNRNVRPGLVRKKNACILRVQGRSSDVAYLYVVRLSLHKQVFPAKMFVGVISLDCLTACLSLCTNNSRPLSLAAQFFITHGTAGWISLEELLCPLIS